MADIWKCFLQLSIKANFSPSKVLKNTAFCLRDLTLLSLKVKGTSKLIPQHRKLILMSPESS